MHKTVVITMVAVLLGSQALAGFNVRKTTFRIDQLDAAKAEAQKEGKPISFIYSDENTTCGLCTGSSIAMLDGLKKKSVIVYVNTDANLQKMPKSVFRAMCSAEAGTFIPKAVVVDPEISKIIAIVPYGKGGEQEKLLKEANRKISKAAVGEKKPPEAPSLLRRPAVSGIRADESREMRTWKARNGAEVRASLVSETGGSLILKKEDGGRLQIGLSDLSDADQKYVAALKEQIGKSARGEDPSGPE